MGKKRANIYVPVVGWKEVSRCEIVHVSALEVCQDSWDLLNLVERRWIGYIGCVHNKLGNHNFPRNNGRGVGIFDNKCILRVVDIGVSEVDDRGYYLISVGSVRRAHSTPDWSV